MPSNPNDDLVGLVELAARKVRTLEGARLYGKPIGSVINEGGPDDEPEKRPITIERLKSLQAQFEEAKRVGNTALMKTVQEEFSTAVREFSATHQDPALLRQLVGSRGRQEQAAAKAT